MYNWDNTTASMNRNRKKGYNEYSWQADVISQILGNRQKQHCHQPEETGEMVYTGLHLLCTVIDNQQCETRRFTEDGS